MATDQLPASWIAAPWASEMRRLFLEVVKHEEHVEVQLQYAPSGEVVGSTPIEGTRTAFLHLRAPDGVTIRVQVPPESLDHFLGLMMPGYTFG